MGKKVRQGFVTNLNAPKSKKRTPSNAPHRALRTQNARAWYLSAGSKIEHAVYARNMSRALSHDEQQGPLEAVCNIFDPSEVLRRSCAFDRDQLPENMRVPVPPTATAAALALWKRRRWRLWRLLCSCRR